MTAKLQLFELDNYIIGNIQNSKDNSSSKSNNLKSKFILILDTSGSMGNLVLQVLETVEKSLLAMNYSPRDTISIITFDSNVRVYETTIDLIRRQGIRSSGCTYFHEVPNVLVKILSKDASVNVYNILCVSDGEISSQELAMRSISEIKPLIPNGILCNVCSVRLFSSTYASPDTRTLVGVSQLDNSGKVTVLQEIEYGKSVDILLKFMQEQFTSEITTLESSTNNLIFAPWKVIGNKSMILSQENNWLYFTSMPTTNSLTINSSSVEILPVIKLEHNNYIEILSKVFEKIDNEIRALKIVNTKESSETLIQVSKFINTIQEWESNQISLNSLKEDITLNEYSLIFRRQLIQKRITSQHKSIINKLQELINVDNVSKLNSNQKADFLRSNVEATAKSKRLVRLAGLCGDDNFDLDERVRIEVQNICKNINKLDSVDEMTQETSFYSQETCVESLRQLHEILPYLNSLTASDIFKLINIVGIGCNCKIQEYPDARVWKPVEIYPSCNISMCDIIMYHTVKKGSKSSNQEINNEYDYTQGIPVPGFPGKFVNSVVPVFSSQLVLDFLYNYAPTILEVTTSINIMRLVIDIPDSFYYVQANGAYKIIQDMCNNDTGYTELYYTVLQKLLSNINKPAYINNYRRLFLCEEPLLNMTSFTNTTNTIVPVSVITTLDKDQFSENNFNKISTLLRATYNFDVYHQMRGYLRFMLTERQIENDEIIKQELIRELLMIDFNMLPNVGELFTDDPVFEEIKIKLGESCDEIYKKFESRLVGVKYLSQIPCILTCESEGIKEGWSNIESNISKILGIEYDNFKVYTVHQLLLALLFSQQNERVDVENKKVLVPDFVKKATADKFFNDYVNNIYSKEINKRLANKHAKEITEMSTILADTIIQESDKDKIINLFKSGLTENVRGNTIVTKFVNQYSEGVTYLLNSLTDEKFTIPLRGFKLKVLILGVDDQLNRVWNGDNIIKGIKKSVLEPFFTKEEWQEFDTISKLYRTHTYRESDKPNRCGHCNSNPSWYGLGYGSWEEFLKTANKDEILSYIKSRKHKKYQNLELLKNENN